MEAGAPERTGWPFAAVIRLPDVTARRNLGGTAFEWRAERVEVSLLPLDPGAVRITPSGQQAVGFGQAPAIPVQAAASWLRMPLSGAGPAIFELRDLTAGPVHVGLVNGQVATLAVGLTAAPVTVSPGLAPPFEQGFAVTVGVSLNRMLHDASSPRDTAAAWQTEGGQVTVPRLELQWGPVHLTGSGSGGLDARLQPTGRATLQMEGGAEVLEAAARAGLVAPGPASAMRAVLGLLTLASPGGAVSLPVTLEDRRLTLAQFPLARLPPVAW